MKDSITPRLDAMQAELDAIRAELKAEREPAKPERWVPKEGEKIWVLAYNGDLLPGKYCFAADAGALAQSNLVPYTDEGKLWLTAVDKHRAALYECQQEARSPDEMVYWWTPNGVSCVPFRCLVMTSGMVVRKTLEQAEADGEWASVLSTRPSWLGGEK